MTYRERTGGVHRVRGGGYANRSSSVSPQYLYGGYILVSRWVLPYPPRLYPLDPPPHRSYLRFPWYSVAAGIIPGNSWYSMVGFVFNPLPTVPQ